jgi:hypothetical protein
MINSTLTLTLSIVLTPMLAPPVPQGAPATAPAAAPADGTAVSPATSTTDNLATSTTVNPAVTALLNRATAPDPDAARMRRALAIAGLDGVVTTDAITAAVTSARTAYQSWRTETEAAAIEECNAAVASEPGTRVPRRSINFITQRRLDGFRFERDAFEQLLKDLPAGSDDATTMAREALEARQAEAIAKNAALNGVADLGRADLVECALRCVTSSDISPEQLRAVLTTYERERTRLLQRASLAVLESDARSLRISNMIKAWEDRRAANSGGADKSPSYTVATGSTAARIAIALQTGPMADASAEMARFQQKTAAQLDTVLSPQSAWCMYATLIASNRKDQLSGRIADIANFAETLPPERRDVARVMIREFCTKDRPAMQETVRQLVEALEAQVQPVRSLLRNDALTDAELTALETQLAAPPATAASYGMSSVMDGRVRATNDLERAVRALAGG